MTIMITPRIKIILITVAMVFPFAVAAQQDSAGLREIFSNGQTKSEGQFNDEGKKTGTWIEYYKSGDTLSIKNYNDGFEIIQIYKGYKPIVGLFHYTFPYTCM